MQRRQGTKLDKESSVNYVNSNPDIQGIGQLSPEIRGHDKGEIGSSNQGIEELVEDMDRVDLFQKVGDGLPGMSNGGELLRDNNIISGPNKPIQLKSQATWRRYERSKREVNVKEGAGSNAESKKRQFNEEEEIKFLKKQKEVLLECHLENESSLAEVGNCQLRRSS